MAEGVLIPGDALAVELAKRYHQAQRELDELIGEAITSGRLDETAYLNARLQRVIEIVTALDAAVKPKTIRAIIVSYVAGSNGALVQLKNIGARLLGGKASRPLDVDEVLRDWDAGARFSFGTGVDERAVKLLVENATQKIEDVNTVIGRQAAGILRNAALEAVTQSTIQGSTVQEGAARLRGILERAGVTYEGTLTGGKTQYRLVKVSGRNYRLRPYSEMVVRTLSREAHSHALANRLVANQHYLVTVSQHAGGGDAECGPYQGKTFALIPGILREDGSEWPVIPQYPPFHPRCRHVLTPAAIF